MPSLAELHARCYVPRRDVVAGRELRPFTLGHAIALEVLGLRTIAADDFAGLLMAVEVCRRPPGEFLRKIQNPWFALRLMVRARWIAFRRSPGWLREQMAAFREYCDYYGQLPLQRRSEASETEAEESGAPFLEHVLVTLLARLHYAEPAALALPLGTALLRYFIFWESEGRVQLIDAAEEARIAELTRQADERHAEILAKANARLFGHAAPAQN